MGILLSPPHTNQDVTISGFVVDGTRQILLIPQGCEACSRYYGGRASPIEEIPSRIEEFIKKVRGSCFVLYAEEAVKYLGLYRIEECLKIQLTKRQNDDPLGKFLSLCERYFGNLEETSHLSRIISVDSSHFEGSGDPQIPDRTTFIEPAPIHESDTPVHSDFVEPTNPYIRAADLGPDGWESLFIEDVDYAEYRTIGNVVSEIRARTGGESYPTALRINGQPIPLQRDHSEDEYLGQYLNGHQGVVVVEYKL